MKRALTLLAMSSLLISGTAFAISDDGENSLGVYFDTGFTQTCLDVIPSVPAYMYFVLANCTQASIGGFEFGWEFNPNPVGLYFILGATFPPGALNIGNNNNLIVGLGIPYLTSEATVLVTFNMLFLAPGIEADISAGPANPPSIPGHAAFNDGVNPALLFPMNFSTVDGTNVVIDPNGWVRPGIGKLFCPGPIAAKPTSWGSMKALYR